MQDLFDAAEAYLSAHRANSNNKKADILERIFVIWKSNPHLRLGQLIGNLGWNREKLYYTEDSDFIEAMEKFYGKKGP